MSLLLLFVVLPAEAASDYQAWTAAGATYRHGSALRLRLDQHLRLGEGYRGHSRHSAASEITAYFRASGYLRLEGGYRYTADIVTSLEPAYVDSWHRFFAGARLRYRARPVTFTYRALFQEQFGMPWGRSSYRFTHTIRNRVAVGVEARNGLSPYLSTELFTRLGDGDDALHKGRLTVGLEYERGRHTFGIFYRPEKKLSDPRDPLRQIFGLTYDFGFSLAGRDAA